MTAGAGDLLDALWGEGWHSLCWQHPGGGSFCFELHDTPAGLLEAAARLDEFDVWFGVHGMGSKPARRGTVADVTSVRCLAADLDWFGPVHPRASVSEDEVRSGLDALGVLAPSLTVHSGFGLQAYWLLGEDVGAGRGAELQARLDVALEGVGLHNDRPDLATVLRLPGSRNWKVAGAGGHVATVVIES